MKNDTLKNGTSRIGLYESASPGDEINLIAFQKRLFGKNVIFRRLTNFRVFQKEDGMGLELKLKNFPALGSINLELEDFSLSLFVVADNQSILKR